MDGRGRAGVEADLAVENLDKKCAPQQRPLGFCFSGTNPSARRGRVEEPGGPDESASPTDHVGPAWVKLLVTSINYYKTMLDPKFQKSSLTFK